MMKSVDNTSNLQKRIFYISLIGVFLTGIFVFIATSFPLYEELRADTTASLLGRCNLRRLTTEHFFARLSDIALQVTSRSRIRQELQRFNKGEIARDTLTAFTEPKIADALDLNEAMLGVIRLDRKGTPVAKVGTAVPLNLAPVLFAAGQRIAFSAPLKVEGHGWAIIVAASILSPEGEHEGTDLILFRLRQLSDVVGIRTTDDIISDVVLSYRQASTSQYFGANPDRSDLSEIRSTTQLLKDVPHGNSSPQVETVTSADGTEFIVATARVGKTGWSVHVVSKADSVFAHIRKSVVLSAAIVGVLLAACGTGVWLLLRPISGRIVVATSDLESEIEKRTERLSQEVSEKERLAAAYRDSETKLRAVIRKHTGVVLTSRTPKAVTSFSNKPYEEWLGVNASEILGKTAREFLPASEEVDNLDAAERSVIETGEVVTREVRVVRGDRFFETEF